VGKPFHFAILFRLFSKTTEGDASFLVWFLIPKFEIWRALSGSVITEADYQKVGEVNASVFSYFDYNGLVDGSTYVYVIRCVDADGHRSPIDKF
jgi:hypothetical protein